jgi:hypothetical protein
MKESDTAASLPTLRHTARQQGSGSKANTYQPNEEEKPLNRHRPTGISWALTQHPSPADANQPHHLQKTKRQQTNQVDQPPPPITQPRKPSMLCSMGTSSNKKVQQNIHQLPASNQQQCLPAWSLCTI